MSRPRQPQPDLKNARMLRGLHGSELLRRAEAAGFVVLPWQAVNAVSDVNARSVSNISVNGKPNPGIIDLEQSYVKEYCLD